MAQRVWNWVRALFCLGSDLSSSEEDLINKVVINPLEIIKNFLKQRNEAASSEGSRDDFNENCPENIYGIYQAPEERKEEVQEEITRLRQRLQEIDPAINRIRCEEFESDDEPEELFGMLSATQMTLFHQREELRDMREDLKNLDNEWTTIVYTLAREWCSKIPKDKDLADGEITTFPLLEPVQDDEWNKKVERAREIFMQAEEELIQKNGVAIEAGKATEELFEERKMTKDLLIPMVEAKRSFTAAEEELRKKEEELEAAGERVALVKYLMQNPECSSTPVSARVAAVENIEGEVILYKGHTPGFDVHAPRSKEKSLDQEFYTPNE